MTGPEPDVQDVGDWAVEGLVLTAYLDASGVRLPGSVQILFEAGFQVETPPDEVTGAVDEMAQICSGIMAGRIGPAVQAIGRETGIVPGVKVGIFLLDFRYTDDHGQCVWKVRPELNPKLVGLEGGIVAQIAEECAERCAPVMAGRFTDCAQVRNWTVG